MIFDTGDKFIDAAIKAADYILIGRQGHYSIYDPEGCIYTCVYLEKAKKMLHSLGQNGADTLDLTGPATPEPLGYEEERQDDSD